MPKIQATLVESTLRKASLPGTHGGLPWKDTHNKTRELLH